MKKSWTLSLCFFLMVCYCFGQLKICNKHTDVDHIKRSVVAIKDDPYGIYVSWALLRSDRENTFFNIYRIENGGRAVKLNRMPIRLSTNFYDSTANLSSDNRYFVKAVGHGLKHGTSDTVSVWEDQYLTIPLNVPANDFTPDGKEYYYTPNDASVGDLDGDGEYEIVLKWTPSSAKDNGQWGYTGTTYLDAYELDGTPLWRIDLGINCRAGAHYNPFMVYDLDGDGMAEVALRTASGTRDGLGNFLSKGPAATDTDTADYRNTGGFIITGPEYLTIFKGLDGSEINTINLEPDRGAVSDWGDSYGNRVDRFLGAVAYLDGKKPSLLWCRGIYEKMEIAAYDWDGTDLHQRWIFKTQEGFDAWAGMGSHNLSIGDVDQDGHDEIVYGNCAIDEYGQGLWTLSTSIGKATGDAMHLADIMPERPGLEKWGCMEQGESGSQLVDAATGEVIWKTGKADVGRTTAGDLSPDYYGMEVWGGTDGLRSANNIRVGGTPSSTNHVVWWDGDLSRELLDGIRIAKYQQGNIFEADGCLSNNTTKANPCLQADIFGDWREEVIWRTSDNASLRIYTTKISTAYRIPTLMHDRQYRLAIAWQNDSYNQPPHTGFYLGNDMFTPLNEIPPSSPMALSVTFLFDRMEVTWDPTLAYDLEGYFIYRSFDGNTFERINEAPYAGTRFLDSLYQLDILNWYYVTAVDVDGNESEPTEAVSVFPTLRPDAPHPVYTRYSEDMSFLFWHPVGSTVDSVIGYNVYQSPASTGVFEQLNDELITTTSYLHDGLAASEVNFYFITTIDAAYRESFSSDTVEVVTGDEILIQGEAGEYSGAWHEFNNLGFHGTGFINFDAVGYLQFRYVYAPADGDHALIIRYALGNTNRTGTLSINDTTFSYTMESTGGWTNYVYDTLSVRLVEGFSNTIRFDATGGDFGNVDEILFGAARADADTAVAARYILSDFSEAMDEEGIMRIFPNPVDRGEVMVEIGASFGEARYQFFETSGRVLHRGRLSPGMNTLSVKHFRKGLYLFQVHSVGGGLITKKILIE